MLNFFSVLVPASLGDASSKWIFPVVSVDWVVGNEMH